MRELWARRIALLTGQLVLLLAIVFAIAQNPVESPDAREQVPSTALLEPAALEPQHIESGRQVYQQQTCARCHSIAGEGNPRNPLDGVGARRDLEELRDWIIGAESLEGVMPDRAFRMKQPYGGLPAGDLDALVIYMRSLRN